jgi:putative ABC transport system permease protein
MKGLLQDIRYGSRMLTRTRSISAVAVLTLALGISVNALIFSLVNALLLRPLRLREPDRLVMLTEQNTKQQGWQRNPALATSLDWRKHAQSFAAIEFGVTYNESANLISGSETQRIETQFVSPDLLGMMGLKPMIGRGFSAQDATGPGSNVIVSHSLWQQLWGGEPNVIGKSLETSLGTYTVIGVMPPDTWIVPWARNPGIWIPLDPAGPDQRPDTRWWGCIARLKPGITVPRARAEMAVFGKRLAQADPDKNKDWELRVVPIRDYWYGQDKPLLVMLMGAVGFVLLIACANVANLLLARSGARATEMAIRSSMGGSRGRLIRQLLTESVFLALIGGVLGLGLSYLGVTLLFPLIPKQVLSVPPVSIDETVLGFTLVLSMLTGILFGLAPAVRVSRVDLNRALKEGGDRSGGSRQLGGNLLVVGEMALTLVLLTGAGLMINSFIRVSRVNLGFDPLRLLLARVDLDGNSYRELMPDDMQRLKPATDAFWQEAVERLEKIPGVVSASFEGATRECPFRIAGRPEQAPETSSAVFVEAGEKYFATMQIPLRAGRPLGPRDDAGAPWVAVINAAMANRYFADGSPIGQQVFISFTDTGGRRVAEGRPREIVGVVGDVRMFGPANDPPAMIYVPFRQHIRDYPGGASSTHLSGTLVVRTSGNPLAYKQITHKVIGGIDRTQVVAAVASMEEAADAGVAQWRVYTQIFGFLAALAIVLAVGGIYGVVSFMVSRRTHEIGVRIALGAGYQQVIGMVLKQGLKLVLLGILIGLAGAYGLTRGVQQLLYEVSPTDVPTLLIVCLVLSVVSITACYLPARRAMRVDPVRALRNE